MAEYFITAPRTTTVIGNDGVEVKFTADVLAIYLNVTRNRSNHPGGKPKKGWRSPLPYSLFHEEVRYPSGFVQVYDGNSRPMTRTGPWGDLWVWQMNNLPADPADRLVQTAINDALSKIKDGRANLLVALKEAKQTAALLETNAERVTDVFNRHRSNVKRLMRGRPLHAFIGGKDWRKIPSMWLEVQFGVKPLLSDIDGSINAVINSASKDNLGLGVTVKGKAKDTDSWYTSYVFNNGYNLGGTSKAEYGATVRLDYTSSEMALEAAKRVGLTNPLSFAWEATRMSWLVDYFYSIGDAIDLMDATTGFNFRSGSYSFYSVLNESVSPIGDPKRMDISVQKGLRRRVYTHRVPYPMSPLALPVAKIGLTPPRLANVLSVLSQSVKATGTMHKSLRV